MITADSMVNEVLSAYDFGAPIVGAIRFGKGHINDTFCVHTQPEDDCCRCYILQRISSAAFKKPEELMSNIVAVTSFLGQKITACGGDRKREALEIIPTKLGTPYHIDSTGRMWRVFTFIADTICYQSASTPELFATSGLAFGKFQRLLADFPAHELFEVIPHFHDTEDRLNKLKEAIRLDPLKRAESCSSEINFALSREADCSVALNAQRQGLLPLRVTHNDTKLNNVLIDKATGTGICVIDLDTTMPGLSINDFGDSIRFGANHSAEDETDLSKVNFDLHLYRVYAQGFLEGVAGSLTQAEINYLPWGARLMTLECGIRFLTDHLLGDNYFRISRPNQNLDRCRTQFKLVADMELNWTSMQQIIADIQRT